MIETKLLKELKPEHITVICDTREQTPLNLAPLKMERGTLATGDYSVKGLEHVISIERKSIDDLVQSLTHERERFKREIHRMLAYPHRALVIEGNWNDIEAGAYRSRAHPNSIIGSLLSLIGDGIPVIMCDSHQRAGLYVARMLHLWAKKRWAEGYSILENCVG